MGHNELNYLVARWNLVAAAILLILLVGCISSPKYPEVWADISENDDCKNIAGYFEDRGENLEGDQYSVFNSIYMMLMEGDPRKSPDVRYIHITQSNGEMVLSASMKAYAGDEWIEKRTYPVKRELCKNGFLEIKVPESTKTYSNEVGYSAYKFYYRVAMSKDGSLIVVSRSYGVGTISLVPAFASSHKKWFRFKPKQTFD
jgi:hypothetical protein